MLPPCFPLLPPLSRVMLANSFRTHDFLLRMWWGGDGLLRGGGVWHHTEEVPKKHSEKLGIGSVEGKANLEKDSAIAPLHLQLLHFCMTHANVSLSGVYMKV